MAKFVDVAGPTVFMGNNIPSHDETHDLAESIGKQLDQFRDYVESVRDSKQADAAVVELLQAFMAQYPGLEVVTETVAVYYAIKADGSRSTPFRSYGEALEAQTAEAQWADVEDRVETVRYVRADMDSKARKHVQDNYQTVSIQGWTTFSVWEWIKDYHIGGREMFLIDNQ